MYAFYLSLTTFLYACMISVCHRIDLFRKTTEILNTGFHPFLAREKRAKAACTYSAASQAFQ